MTETMYAFGRELAKIDFIPNKWSSHGIKMLISSTSLGETDVTMKPMHCMKVDNDLPHAPLDMLFIYFKIFACTISRRKNGNSTHYVSYKVGSQIP